MDAAVAVAASELRGAQRRWRTWLCVGVGVVVLFVLNGFYTYAHAEMSGDAAMAFFSPRFGASYGQAYVLWLLLAGLLLLAFDVPHRDRRERMVDVLDARPVSNVAVLFGRLAGIVLAAWLPLAAACALIQVLGLGARVLGLWFGQPVEPYAQAAFVFLDALPVMVLWVAAILFPVSVPARSIGGNGRRGRCAFRADVGAHQCPGVSRGRGVAIVRERRMGV